MATLGQLVNRGQWNASTTYSFLLNQLQTEVTYNGGLYVTVSAPPRGVPPTGNPAWSLVLFGSGGGGTAADITLSPIPGVNGTNVQTGMQSLASEFTDSKVSDDIITSFQAVYLATDGKVKRASASSVTTANVFGIALQSGVVGANLVIQTAQEVSSSSWNWDINRSIWLDTTLGGLTQTRPTAAGTQLCYLGMPTSSTSFILTPIGSRYLGQN